MTSLHHTHDLPHALTYVMVNLRAYLQLSPSKSGEDEEGVHGDFVCAGDRLQKDSFLAEFMGQALSANGTGDTIMHTHFHPSRTSTPHQD